MERKDPYQTLGVARSATQDEIRTAYRQLAREHHPDVNPGDQASEERFKQISAAKEILLDEEKRKLYDEFGFDGLAAGFDPEEARSYKEWHRRAQRSPRHEGFRTAGSADMEDLLSQLFGARAAPSRGADLESELEVAFLDAVLGTETRLVIAGRNPLRVQIPAGVEDGARIRLAGKGAPAPPGGTPGDLYIRVRVRPHPRFSREGNDLHLDLPVTLPELILGAEIDVPTPDGPVQMRVPARSANGQRLRLRGRGVGKPGSKARGDLYLRLSAVLPSQDGERERLEAIARDLEPLYADLDVRASLREELRS